MRTMKAIYSNPAFCSLSFRTHCAAFAICQLQECRLANLLWQVLQLLPTVRVKLRRLQQCFSLECMDALINFMGTNCLEIDAFSYRAKNMISSRFLGQWATLNNFKNLQGKPLRHHIVICLQGNETQYNSCELLNRNDLRHWTIGEHFLHCKIAFIVRDSYACGFVCSIGNCSAYAARHVFNVFGLCPGICTCISSNMQKVKRMAKDGQGVDWHHASITSCIFVLDTMWNVQCVTNKFETFRDTPIDLWGGKKAHGTIMTWVYRICLAHSFRWYLSSKKTFCLQNNTCICLC